MPEPLKPIFEIPVEKSRDGSFSYPQMEFSPSEPVLYVREVVEPFSWVATASWYAPDVAAPLLIVAAALLAITIRRFARDPREPGRMYCRRCNYKITPPMAARGHKGEILVQVGARCPECGTDLAARLPIIGCRAGARLWPAWGLFLPLVLACVLALFLTLDRRTGTRGQSWPIADLEKVLGRWAVQKHDSTRMFIHTENRVTRWRVPQGTRVGGAWWADVHGFQNGYVSPDGAEYVCVVQRPGPWPSDVLLIDTRTGQERAVALNRKISGGANILGFSRDGSSVYVQVLLMPMQGGRDYEFKLVAIQLGSLDRTELATIALPGVPYGESVQPPYGYFVVDDGGTRVRWAFQHNHYDTARAPTRSEITYFDGVGRHEYSVPAQGKGWQNPRFEDDGRTLEVNFYGTAASVRIDLATDAIAPGVSRVPAHFGASASKRYWLVQGKSSKEVLDTATGATIARLAVPGNQLFGGAAISNDGRFVATTYWSSSSKYGIGVWDLGEGAGSQPQTQPAVPATVP